MANIRINALPADAAPSASDVVPIDGLTTRKATLTNIVNAGRPFASQAEAEAGVNTITGMSPLTTAQAIAAQGGTAFASAAQGALASSAVQSIVGGVSTSVDATDPIHPIINFTGTGTGDLLAANNLSDVANAAAALGNLGGQPLDADLTAIAALTTTAFGRSLLTKAAAEDVRDAVDAVVYVADRAALAALTTAKDKTAIIWSEGGRNGLFVFSSSNLSALVTSDTAQGMYVAPTSAPTGASGAWVRQNSGPVNAKWFGLDAAGTAAANTTALTAAMNFVRPLLGALHISSGDYNLNAVTITMTGDSDTLHVVGDGYGKTNLRWNGTDGISITMVSGGWWLMRSGAPGNVVTVHGITFIQDATSGAAGKALAVDGNNTVARPAPFFLVSECVFRSAQAGATWSKCIELTSVSSATIEKTYGYGALSDHTLGTFLEVIATTGQDASPFHIRGCEAYFFNRVIAAGQFIEGIHVTDCDFVSVNFGVVWNATNVGAEAQLCMIGTHINAETRCIQLQAIQYSQISNNLFFVSNTNSVAIDLLDCSSTSITGNGITATNTGSVCISVSPVVWTSTNYSARQSVITDNVLEGVNFGVTLASAVRNYFVEGNICKAGMTEVSDASGLNYIHNVKKLAFVPAIAGTTAAGAGTYSQRDGWFKRAGEYIEGEFTLTWSAHTGTGNIQISGLPMAAAYSTPALLYIDGVAHTAGNMVQAIIGNGGTTITLTQVGAGAAVAIPMTTSGRISCKFNYPTA